MWTAGAVLVALAGVAAAGTLQLRRDADLARSQQLALERVRALVHEQTSLEWQAVAAQGAAAELASQIRSRTAEMALELEYLGTLDASRDTRLVTAFEVHQRALQDEVRLLAAGRLDEALALGETRVDPSLRRLSAALQQALGDSAGRARTATLHAAAVTGLLVAFVSLFLTLVGLGFRRARRSVATADARALRQSERWFHSLVQNASELIAVVDPDTTVRYATESSVPLLGYEPRRLVGRQLVSLAHPEDAERLRDAASTPTPGGSFECRLWTRDEAWVVLEWVCGSRPDEPGCILTGRDVTERKRLEQELRHQAFHDALTGLANRALFEDRLNLSLAALPRRADGIAVLFIDVDDFKTVNDSLGHGPGDTLLRAIGERLRSSLRDSDTAARLGGDEFAILLEGIADPQAAVATAERVLASLRAPFDVDGRLLQVTGSVGVAPAFTGGATMEELMRNADLAMYDAKRAGGARCRLYAEEMHEVALTRLELGGELRRAVEQGEFELYFQPIVGLESTAIVGAEALLRWRHPERGLLAPGQFLPLAEESGLIVPLGRWVIEESTRALRRWQDAFPELPFHLSANLSMRQLYEPEIIEHIRAALDDAGVSPSRFVIEITESFLADESEAPRLRLQRLRALGVRLAVDDFGTGYSALSYLQRFPIDILKIDRSFVEHARAASPSLSLVRSIVRLGQSLHLDIVAEGIEEAEQAEQLRQMGVGAGQGYYFAKPLPADRFGELLASGLGREPARTQLLEL